MAGFAPPNPTLVEVGAQVLYYLGLSTAFGIGMVLNIVNLVILLSLVSRRREMSRHPAMA